MAYRKGGVDMAEYNNGRIVLRDTSGNQMSLPRFFELALTNDDGTHKAQPSSGMYRNGSTEFHGAWDMGAGTATDVKARSPVSGTVVFRGGMNGFGPNMVIIKEDGYERYHYFGHMASAVVNQNDYVVQGDVVGIIGGYGGSPGNWNPSAYGIHLHYEIMDVNIAVTGGWSGDINHDINPMDVYDNTTLPSGWIFGYDPVTQPSNYAALAYNWEYLALDHTATDFGPPGGDTPSEPFYTEGYVYDVSVWQTAAEVQELCSDSTTGGLVLRFAWNDGQDSMVATHLAAAISASIPVGFYSASDKNITHDGEAAYRSMLEAQANLLTTTMGIQPSDCLIGVWLDLESWGVPLGGAGCGLSATPAENLRQVVLFREIFGAKGFPTLGWYSNKNELINGMVGNVDISWKEFPYWYARPGQSRSTVEAELASYGIVNCYLWQDGDGGTNWSPDKTYRHQNVDNDTVLQPIPTSGGGGGGGEYTEVIDVTVDIVAPKRIYFSPVPGLLTPGTSILSDISASIQITTDADNANLYYTTDGSSPYQYTNDGTTTVFTLAANAMLYDSNVVIYKDTHIRVIAVPLGVEPGDMFEKPLARGSGTFLFAYNSPVADWESEQQSYATANEDTSFFEENRQAFLRIHDIATTEEIEYTSVYRHDTQKYEENAIDNASTTTSTTPDEGEI